MAGSAAHSNGTFTVVAGGLDIWGVSDQFRFVYQQVTGNAEIVARVASITNPDPWSKAGVMVREQLTANSRHAFSLISANVGLAFQRRKEPGGITENNAGSQIAPPSWVKLVRAGSVFSAYMSTNGTTWTLLGSDTIAMNATVYVGLAVTAHTNVASTTASITNVSVSGAASGNRAPTVSLTSPGNGSTYVAPASVTLTATAADPDGSVNLVDFYAGSAWIGSDTSSPYSYTWTGVSAGAYGVRAVATDNGGATATSESANVTVAGAPTATLRLVFTPSTDHATNVTVYSVEVFLVGRDPETTDPALWHILGKPAVSGGTISVDMLPIVAQLPSGSYFASVLAIGPFGRTRGVSSNVFVR